MKKAAFSESDSFTSTPLRVPFFSADFSKIPTNKLKEYSSMLDVLSYCIDLESPAVVDVWKVLSRISSMLRCELYKRDNEKYTHEKENKAKRLKGECIAVPKKRVIRPVKAKK